jgi:hypothetical protein
MTPVDPMAVAVDWLDAYRAARIRLTSVDGTKRTNCRALAVPALRCGLFWAVRAVVDSQRTYVRIGGGGNAPS